MSGILLSLFPLFGWGTSDYISSRFSKKYHPALINLAFSFFSLLPTIVLCLIYDFPDFTLKGLGQFWLVSMALTIGFISMVKAFSRGATGVVSPIANSYVLLTAVLSAVLLGNALAVHSYAAIVVIVAGIGLLTYKKDPNHNKKDFAYSVKYSVLALVFFGIGFILFDVASTQEWYQNNMFFQLVGATNAAIIYSLWVKKNRWHQFVRISKDPLTYVGAFIATFGTIGFFAALTQVENVAIPAAVAAASPLMTAFLAYIFDKEHLTIVQRLATAVIVGGIVLLSV